MIVRNLSVLLFAIAATRLFAGETSVGENFIEMKLALPKGDTYIRGTTDPVADLVAEITLTNKSEKEDLNKKPITIKEGEALTSAEIAKLKTLTPEEQQKLLDKKITTRDGEELPINPKSLGYAYVEPELGGQDTIEFVITRLPEEGADAAAPKDAAATPVEIARDHGPVFATPTANFRTRYLAAGETSPPYVLHFGKYYTIDRPGLYAVKARMRSIGDSNSPDKALYSNEEKFRVVPFKSVDQTIDYLKSDLEDFERGYPQYAFMLYQVKSSARYDEIYAVQRVTVGGVDHWEWSRVCTVKTGTSAQLKTLSPNKLALLAVQQMGDIGLYTLDFSNPGVKVTTQLMPGKADGSAPKLKLEGGTISVE